MPLYEATIFEDCLSAQDRPDDLSAEGAADVWTVAVPVVEGFGLRSCSSTSGIDEGQIGVLSDLDSALVGSRKRVATDSLVRRMISGGESLPLSTSSGSRC